MSPVSIVSEVRQIKERGGTRFILVFIQDYAPFNFAEDTRNTWINSGNRLTWIMQLLRQLKCIIRVRANRFRQLS